MSGARVNSSTERIADLCEASRLASSTGFTLIEVLLAMGLLVIGMTGILTLFSVALDLEAKAAERHEVAASIPEVINRIADDLRGRPGVTDTRPNRRVANEFPLAEGSRYRCSYEVEHFPGDHDGRCVLARVKIIVPAPGGERAIDFGYLPVVLPSPNAALLRAGPK
jgi:prepilin-type N-terminal cleavage/methylation domain-containing protein